MLTMPAGAEWMRDSAAVSYEDLLNDASMGWCGGNFPKLTVKPMSQTTILTLTLDEKHNPYHFT